MLPNKILWKKICNLWPSRRQMVWMITPQRFSSVKRSIAIANIYGASKLPQLYCTKMDKGKPSNIESISRLPPLQMDLNIQGCGALSWIQEDKESLINGTRGVKIVLCDGKHMEFSTVQPQTWQGSLRPLPAFLSLCSFAFCQLEDTGCVLCFRFPRSGETGSAVRLPYRLTETNLSWVSRNQ